MTFWHSTGGAALSKMAGPFDATTQSNGADWHLGVLRLPGASDAPGAEDWFFSGVYVESGELTTAVGAGGAEAPVKSAVPVVSATSVAAASSSAAAVVVETPVASSSAEVVEVPASSPTSSIAAISSSAAPVVETPVASSTPVALETPSPVASSTPVATPTVPAGAGAGSNATLPEEFTIRQFVAWLKAKQGLN